MPPIVSDWQDRWTGLSPNRRRSLITWVVTGVLAAIATFVVLSQTPYTPVMTSLTPAAAGQVTDALGSLKIPYELADGGTTILVPSADADQARVDLAMQNLPSNGQVGYQNLTGITDAGMTSQQFTAAELGVLEQDLSSTVAGFQGVTGANVQIAVPPQSVWAAPVTGGTKASVYLDMAGGASPPTAEVNGIIALVAHAVPGLTASGVTVVDQNGTLLTGGQTPGVNTPAGMFQEEQQLDTQDEAAVRQLLIPIVGGNNVEVAVNVAISPEHQTTTETLPETGQVSSRSTQNQSSTGGSGTTSTAGTTGNTTPTYPVTTGSGSSKASSNQTQYAVGTKVQSTVGPPVLVTGITASVVLNQKIYPLTGGRINTIRQLVAGALGIPGRRAASAIVVSAAPFQQVTVAPATSTLPLPLPELEGAAGAVVVLLILAVVLLARRKKGSREREPVTLAEALLPSPNLPTGPPPRSRELMRRLSDVSTQAPEDVAAVLAQWLEQAEDS